MFDLDDVLTSIRGSVLSVAAVDGDIRLQGSLSTSWQVYWIVVEGVPVASDSISILRTVFDLQLDTAVLASKMLLPGAPWPLSLSTIWHGVRGLGMGEWLRLPRAGAPEQHRWWEPEIELDSPHRSTSRMREALLESVQTRTAGLGTVSADLSGGLDSTSLCFVAARTSVPLVTFHVQPLDDHNDDTTWAHRAADLITGTHHTLPPRPERSFFNTERMREPAYEAEGPFLWSSGRDHLTDLRQRVRSVDSPLHLMGFGGDELFTTMPAYLWTLWRERGWRALPTIRRACLLNRYRFSGALRQISGTGSYASALNGAADSLARGGAPRSAPQSDRVLDLSWSPRPSAPPWMSGDAVDTVRDLLLQSASRDPQPLHPDRSRHQMLESLLFEGSLVRQINEIYGNGEIAWEAPFLDTNVVDAALAVPMEDKKSPKLAKPLLASALDGIVPRVFFERRTKGEYSREMYGEIDRVRASLGDYFEDSALAELGLIDAAQLRAAINTPATFSWQLDPLERTIAYERWLRDADTVATTFRSERTAQ